MDNNQNRRRWMRQKLNPPEIGILYTGNKGFVPGHHASKQPTVLFVDLLNRSLGGAIIRTKWQIGQDSEFYLQIFSALEETWELAMVETKWADSDPGHPGYNIIGVEFKKKEPKAPFTVDDPSTRKFVPIPADYEFFRNADIFDVIPRDAVCALLNNISYKHVKSGHRLMKQEAKINTCFIIQNGSCLINLEKNGQFVSIGRRGEGELIGQEAILDDLPLEAHVDAETEMELWGLTRAGFDAICTDHPEMRGFLTNLLKDRFASTQHSEKRKIGGFIITDKIAEGCQSIIYKGAYRSSNLPVTIKMLQHSVSLERGFMEKFQKKIQAVSHLKHPNICKIFWVEERLRTVFVIMEHLVGEPLEAPIRRRKKIPVARTVDFLIQALNGLEYAHNNQVFHGALKPANLFVSPGDRLKILDFGIASLGEHFKHHDTASLSYQPPGQMERDPADAGADIYALGIITYEMLNSMGKPAESTPLFPDPKATLPDMPAILSQFIKKACHHDPGKQFKSVAQALQHLNPLVGELDLPRRNRQEDEELTAVVSLVYKEKSQLALNEIMEEFGRKISDIAARIKSVEIQAHIDRTKEFGKKSKQKN
jgi:serine/threonine protein kinase